MRARKPGKAQFHPQVERLETRALPSTYTVAPNGNDNNNGITAPWLTLQHAANSVHPGDTVVINAGTYKGFDVQTSGTATAPIIYEAAAGAKVILDATETNRGDCAINIEDFNNGSSVNYITIQGLDVDNSMGSGAILDGIRAVSNGTINSTGIKLVNNTINDCGQFGILTSHEDNILIQGNTVSNTKIYKGEGGTGHGIYVGNASFNPKVIGNTIFGNQSLGLHMNGDASEGPAQEPDGTSDGNAGNIISAVVEDNIIYNNGVNGINCDGVQKSLFENNLLYGNGGGIVLYVIDAAAPAIDNVVVNNTVSVAATDIMGNAGRWDIQVMDGTPEDGALPDAGSTGNLIFNNILINHNSAHGSIEIGPLSLSGFHSNYNVISTSADGGSTSSKAFDLLDNGGNDNFVSLATWRTSTSQDTNSLTADSAQLFVAAAGGNYQLPSTSPAIQKAVPSFQGTAAPNVDILGNSRTGANYDIGAYEYQSGVVIPPAPTGLAATPGNAQVLLGWNASAGAASYDVYRGTSAGGEGTSPIATGITSTSFTDTGLTNGITYYYKVSAVNGGGTSGLSNEASATPSSGARLPAALTPTAGTKQSATVGTTFATALQATVTDSSGNPVSGVLVTFSVAGGATFPGGAVSVAVSTNSSGIATAPALTASTTAGSETVSATVPGLASSASFNLANTPGAPAQFGNVTGGGQSAVVGSAFGTPLQVTVEDQFGNPVGAGVAVTFAVPASGASGTFPGGATSVTVNTDASGIATAPALTAVGSAGSFNVSVTSPGAAPASVAATNTRATSAGFDELGAYRPGDGSWSLDSNGQFGFQGGPVVGPAPLADRVLASFSPAGANVIPVSGDWTGIGTNEIGDFENGTWHLDLNNNGVGDPGETFSFGATGDVPVPGDYLAKGQECLAVFRSLANGAGEFIISDPNWLAEAQAGQPIGISRSFIFGAAGDRVVVGDWNGAGLTEVGVFRSAAAFGAPNAAVFSLDIANHHTFDSSTKVFIFGTFTDGVVIGDWNGTGTDKVGVYRAAAAFGAPNTAVFSLDETGDFQFDSSSKVFLYGTPTDKFVTGKWAYTTSTAAATASDPTALDAFFASS